MWTETSSHFGTESSLISVFHKLIFRYVLVVLISVRQNMSSRWVYGLGTINFLKSDCPPATAFSYLITGTSLVVE